MNSEERSNEAYFEGHDGRTCGEHRTVGPHRAWCYDCSQWCYPALNGADPMDGACNGCRVPWLESALATALARIAAVEALCDEIEQNLIDKGAARSTAQLTTRLSTSDVRAVLAASPTPTGPEPAFAYCANGLHSIPAGSDCPSCPATPEPTEETP